MAADCLINTSKYEGFGIPIIESMAADLPIVLSNSDVFREITENKYSYFEPNLAVYTKSKHAMLNVCCVISAATNAVFTHVDLPRRGTPRAAAARRAAADRWRR